MKRLRDLPKTIPIFPLPGALLLPRGRLPLHIFEPRYLSMIEDAIKTDERLIGMVQPHKTPAGDDTLHSIGCVGRITSFTETDDGRYMVSLTGLSRFRIMSEENGFVPYRRASVAWDDFSSDMGKPETDKMLDRAHLISLLERYFAAEELDTDWDAMQSAEDELLINSLSMLCPLSPEDKQALLEAPSLASRRETLVTLLEFAMHVGKADEVRQ